MKQYKTLLFDADNTLLDFTRAEKDALTDTLQLFGLPYTEDVLQTYSLINDGLWKQLERGEITRGKLKVERFTRFLEAHGFQADAEKMSDTYISRLSTKSYLISGVEEVVAELSRTYDLYIITNGTASVQHGRFDPSPISRYFKGSFISDELGAEKPSRAFFEAVMKGIPSFCASQTLVIGDSLSSDILGGIDAGLDTCWYNPSGKPLPDHIAVTYQISTIRELLPLLKKA